MTEPRTQLSPVTEKRPVTKVIPRGLRMVVAHGAEGVLTEVTATLKRLRTLLLVLSISVPVFLIGLVAVLWRLAH